MKIPFDADARGGPRISPVRGGGSDKERSGKPFAVWQIAATFRGLAGLYTIMWSQGPVISTLCMGDHRNGADLAAVMFIRFADVPWEKRMFFSVTWDSRYAKAQT